MTSIADFIKLQKVDFHNYIQLGMSYPSFVTWAGYYIPEFDDKQKRLSKEFQDDFISFARLRIKNQKDMQNLFTLSLAEAKADSVNHIYGVINSTFLMSEELSSCLEPCLLQIKKKFSDVLTVEPVLACNPENLSATEAELILKAVNENLMAEIFIFGNINNKITETCFQDFMKELNENQIKKRISLSSLKKPSLQLKALSFCNPSSVFGNTLFAEEKEITEFLKKNNVKVFFTPDFSEKENSIENLGRKIRCLLENGVSVCLGSGLKLFYGSSLSQFSSELCNKGGFSKEEVESLLQSM